jgi:hypothetical protein
MKIIETKNILEELHRKLLQSTAILDKSCEIAHNEPYHEFFQHMLATRKTFVEEIEEKLATNEDFKNQLPLSYEQISTDIKKFIMGIDASTLHFKLRACLKYIVITEKELYLNYEEVIKNLDNNDSLNPILSRHWKKIRSDYKEVASIRQDYAWA